MFCFVVDVASGILLFEIVVMWVLLPVARPPTKPPPPRSTDRFRFDRFGLRDTTDRPTRPSILARAELLNRVSPTRSDIGSRDRPSSRLGGVTGGLYEGTSRSLYGRASGGAYGGASGGAYGGASGGAYGGASGGAYGGASGGAYGGASGGAYEGTSRSLYGRASGGAYRDTYGAYSSRY